MPRSLRRSRTGVLVTLVAGGVALMIASGAGQQPPAGQAPAPQGGGRGDIMTRFTGKVSIGDASNMRSSRIRFEAGARTHWHVHTAGQLLLVEEGRGRLYEEGGTMVDIPAGQPVYTKANVPHWHGAAPDQHAVQFSVYTGDLKWMQAVTDDEYLGKTRR